jgi:hypothetical protein
LKFLVLVSHLSICSVNICITLWNSREHAPGLLSLASFLRTKSARQSSSEHFNEGNSCWVNGKIKYEHNTMVRNKHQKIDVYSIILVINRITGEELI